MSAVSAWARAGLVVVVVVVVDQLSKHAIRDDIVPGEERKVLPGLALVNTRNRGVAFGLLPGSHIGITILIALALLALLVYFARHATRPLIWLPTGMLIGGALGNILDRLSDGSVTDFIKLPLGWPPFNLADTSITLRRAASCCSSWSAPTEGSPLDRLRRPFTIAYQDDHLLVVDKAPGLVVHPARGHREGTLAQLLGRAGLNPAGGEEGRAGIVHRLDRDTSGLLVVARSEEAHRLLQAALAERRSGARIPRARRGPPAGPQRHDRGPDRARPARAHAHGRRRGQPARGAHPLHARPRCSRAHRCCGCAWRRGAPTRSASTYRRSATPSAATPSTAPPACSGWSASSCTPPAWPSSTRSRATASR